MEFVNVLVAALYFALIAWCLHAPVDLGIQACHLHQRNSPYQAMITIAAGWMVTLCVFLIGYAAGHVRIFG